MGFALARKCKFAYLRIKTQCETKGHLCEGWSGRGNLAPIAKSPASRLTLPLTLDESA